jgi:hypothetical protein
VATSELVKLEREKRKTLNAERALAIITDPQVIGLLTLLGGLYAAQRIPYSDDETQNNTLKGIATGGVVLMSISRAGLGGWPALVAAGLSGVASTEGVGELDPVAKAIGVKSIWSRIFG